MSWKINTTILADSLGPIVCFFLLGEQPPLSGGGCLQEALLARLSRTRDNDNRYVALNNTLILSDLLDLIVEQLPLSGSDGLQEALIALPLMPETMTSDMLLG